MASKNPLFYLVCAVTSVSVVSIVYNLYEANRTKHLPDALNGTSPYDAEVKAALEVALIAGKNLLDALNLPKDMEHKGSTGVDFVTKTDKHNEKIIFNRLKRLFPKHKFIGEETTAETGASTQLTDELTWIVDPIDGTTNFLHSFPITCVSIGLCHHGIPVVGVVVAPALQEVYVGVRGHGAYLNGKRLSATKVTKIKDALLLTELSYFREGAVQDNFFNCLKAVLDEKPHSLRMLGSGVLNLCYVAAGRLDALYCGPSGDGWMPWDYCAGALFVEEAGGVMATLDHGEPFHVNSRSAVAAATRELCEEIHKCVDKGRAGTGYEAAYTTVIT